MSDNFFILLSDSDNKMDILLNELITSDQNELVNGWMFVKYTYR